MPQCQPAENGNLAAIPLPQLVIARPLMSAARERPSTRTASMCAAEDKARVTHSFKVVGSSVHKGFGVGMFVRSAIFSAGGHDWSILYYPSGNANNSKDYAAVFLELVSKNTEATVLYDLRLVKHATGLSSTMSSSKKVFNDKNPSWGLQKFIKKSDLEALGYLKDDCLEIECDLTVIKVDEIDVPPPDLQDHLRKLLESEEGVDVTFKVKEEVFKAHKIVLAMRSPFFKAEFFGPMRNNTKGNIVVEDIEPPVFKALLHFIYTDSWPVMSDLDAKDHHEMVKHLLVAADRYGLERMKVICESILCKKLAIDSIATTMILADRYHCSKLKDACFQFTNSSNRMDDVVASEGYNDLKRECPALTIEIWEKAAKSRKI